MINVSVSQLLDVWMELEDAYRGENTYGGHIAEVYRYLVQQHSPAWKCESESKAEATLINILKLFAEKRNANIRMVSHQGHRYHIKVFPSKGKGKVTIPKEFK